MILRPAIAAVLALSLLSARGAAAQAPVAEGPFEPKLMRLAEVLGSIHYLRNLCGEQGSQWRDEMEKLLAAENPDPARRARFVASFNRGYRSFEGIYSSCTPSATEAISRYMKEGEALSRDIASRFGN
ncbi:MAG TPA: TIGR02301 family protein [Rhizobiaceae bacterium]|nr:TIGR02301 family protein [Rhizobiaceae bacterium]